MRVVNIHERVIPQPVPVVGRLLSTLASDDDRIWPVKNWPAMKFDRPLQVGATGGHGPIGYFVQTFVPSDRIVFRFLAPEGFDGTHSFIVVPHEQGTLLRHELRMKTASLSATWSWLVVYRPLHDALIEDALYKAASNFGDAGRRPKWSWWVRKLRDWLSREQKTT
jgi:hypothetical protein